MVIVEVREVKRLSKKIKTQYLMVAPGEMHYIKRGGDTIVVQAGSGNIERLYLGSKVRR